jgi:hypothetical protein
MANHNSDSKPLSDGIMLAIFLVLVSILYLVGDLFVLILGLIILTPIFAGAYNKAHEGDHH